MLNQEHNDPTVVGHGHIYGRKYHEVSGWHLLVIVILALLLGTMGGWDIIVLFWS